jgi:hypothetical protein
MAVGYTDFNVADRIQARDTWFQLTATVTVAENTGFEFLSHSNPATIDQLAFTLTLNTATDITQTHLDVILGGRVASQLDFRTLQPEYGLGITGGLFNIAVLDIVNQQIVCQLARPINTELSSVFKLNNGVSGGSIMLQYRTAIFTSGLV